jgi:hypothetical protein
MNRGELLTRCSIWIALVAYAVATGLLLQPREHPRRREHARWWWTFGCAFFLLHVLCAFAYFHHWSHEAAYRETARQTSQMTGWQWGGGIYFNYAFAAAWLADVLWRWLASRSFAQRPSWLNAIWHGFFFFMVFNGTIVFGHGPLRLLGLVICLTLATLWLRQRIGHLTED